MSIENNLVEKMNFLESKKKFPKSIHELKRGDCLIRKNIGILVFDRFDGENLVCYESGTYFGNGRYLGNIQECIFPMENISFNFESSSYTEIERFNGRYKVKVIDETNENYIRYKDYLDKLGVLRKDIRK